MAGDGSDVVPWRFALARAAGTSHTASGDPCQDACVCETMTDEDGDEVLVAVVSDGAGSAALSHFGSAVACRTVLEAVRGHLARGLRVGALSREVALQMIAETRRALDEIAAEAGAPVRELACTLVAAVVATDLAAFFQVGDGAVVASPVGEEDRFQLVFWPERGEYANTTAFITDVRVDEHVMHDIVPGAVDDVVLFSDGLQALVLDYQERAAHARFFARVLEPLRTRQQEGRQAELCRALEAYLESAEVDARTDDDKALILASRRWSR